jgi:CDP-diglyceride synthetase
VDDVPEGREDDVTRTDVPVTRPEPSGPASDRVRIVGAEPAGEATNELPAVPGGVVPEDAEAPDAGSPPGDAGSLLGPIAIDPVAEAGGYGLDQPSVRLTDEPGDPGHTTPAVNPVSPGETAVPTGTPPATELPHWTEPPTGKVPAVLSRDAADEGTGSAIVPPTWREEDADWVAHDDEFEPAMFGSDQVALGSLDETDRSQVERRPWEFDLDSVKPGSPSPHRGDDAGLADAISATNEPANDPITEPTDVVASAPAGLDATDSGGPPVGPGRAADPGPVVGRPPVVGAAVAGAEVGATGREERPGPVAKDPVLFATDGDPVVEGAVEPEKPRPTGSARLGRARRNGLRPARMRAKRPDDVAALTDAPLAAEPPGASVTDVPGAGRRRGGLASLAAADRTAVREGEQSPMDTGGRGETNGDAGSGAASEGGAATAGGGRRRLHRGEPSDRTRSPRGGAAVDEPTGGGPPAPRRGRGPASESDVVGPGPHEDTSPIGIRVGTGVAVAVVALLAFRLGTVTSLVLTVVVVTFAAGECFGVLRRAGYHPATLLGLVGTISLMVGAYSKGVAALPLVLVLITVFTLIWYLFGIERGSPVAGTAATLLTVGWVSLLGAYAGLLLSPSSFPNRHGIAFLLGAIIATVANDVGALVIGGWLGSRPLAPNISPNKTWEGLFGGAVFSILASTVVVGNIHPWSASNAALLGVVVAVVAPIGDLCESMLKRELRLKDMGTLLPGHGGVLDRVDALLFVLPATYYLVRALNIA